MGPRARGLVALIDAFIMAGAAYADTGARPGAILTHPLLWGIVAGAVVCAAVAFTGRAAFAAWAAIGFIVFAGLLAGRPNWFVLALAIALMPLVPRPRESLAAGLAVAAVVAVGTPLLLGALP